ncbi:type VI secretion system tube protein TssD [Psychroserpens sp. NJDZ02]|uniref:type VI secretion system tube protein TssD n=1 Tax=Psychroserpens sp. NJDZ02 TaxID=2570561 RepID=UPI0010A833AE|nr:type VI secretion system tube protein TssD [Psychroserpens sp. NJDZ02]QCE40960.1 hypothetical protein E9099_05855 [Psychroserpens sp. NJDZ02]
MSVTGKLIIDDKEINILSFSFRFNQIADINGKPTIKPIFQGLKLVIETRKDLDLADWAFAANQTKQLELRIYPAILGGKTRKLYFYDCHLVNWTNNFSSTGNQPISETLNITAAGVKGSNSTVEYSASWRTTFPQQEVEPTIIESDEPKFLGYHFENKQGEKIQAEQKITLVIQTENAEGETISINLNDDRLDFKYNNKVIENDTLTGVSITGEETRVNLITILEQE